MLPFGQDKKKEELFTLAIPLISWWIPIMGPAITGFLIGLNLDRKEAMKLSVIDSMIGSGLTTLVYYLLRSIISYPAFVVIIVLNILGSVLCIAISLFISKNMTRTIVTNNRLEADFYVNNVNEVEEKLKNYIYPAQCSPPKYGLSENKIEVIRRCGNMNLSYEITEEGSNLYKVHLVIST
ncbi:hypothetical protein [Sulfuracidifex metallicus]|uniref:hypothetical protein n=1 Tax=Sulfuracidifex metallicus TaxID=47303 RepID=UPI0022742BEE|nr:hypothetical protein [Sulfuracidifex metallicus]MCY0849419.1 hypothetical protein [Sulfuracidifex metallicus]